MLPFLGNLISPWGGAGVTTGVMLKNRKSLLLIASGGAIALTVGAVFGYWLSGQQQVAAELPVGAEVLPQEAMMTLSFTTDLQQWRRLRAMGNEQSRAVLDTKLVEWRDRLLTANGYSFARDVQPWVGSEATVALFPAPIAAGAPNAPGAAPAEQRAAVVLPIANPAAAQQVLGDRPPPTQVKEQTYKGVVIRELVGRDREDYATTLLDGRFVVMATDVGIAARIIDTYRGGASLRDAAGYGTAFVQTAMPQPFLRVYVNAPVAKAAATGNGTQTIPLLTLTPLQNSQGLAATVGLEENAVRVRGTSWLPSNSPVRYSGNPGEMRLPSLLPLETPLMVAGTNLQQRWQTFSQNNLTQSTDPFSPSSFQGSIQSLTGLNLEQDFLSWMNGEFSIAVVPLPKPTSDQKTGLVLLASTSDRPTAERTFQQLDEVMRSRYQYQVNPVQVNGRPIVNWVSPFGSLNISHGWLDDQTMFLGMGPSVAEAIARPGSSLSTNALLRVSPPRTPINGQFWLNLEQLRTSGDAFPLPKLPADADAVVGAMRQISLDSGIIGDRASRFDIRVTLQQSGVPNPLPAPQ